MRTAEFIENGYLVELMREAAALSMEVRISPAGGIIMRPAPQASAPAPAPTPAGPLSGADRQRRLRERRKVTKTVTPPAAGVTQSNADVTGSVTVSPMTVTESDESNGARHTSPPPSSPPPLPPGTPNPAPTPAPTPGSESAPADAREGSGQAEEPPASLTGFDPDRVGLLESVLAAYPVNGNATEALRALAGLNATADELRAILAKTQTLVAKWRALPQRERRFAPRKHTFFEERRWEDDPNEEPWTAAPPEARGSAINSRNQSYGNHRGAAKPLVTRNLEPIPAGSPSLNATAVNARKAEGVVDTERPGADEDGDRDW